MERKFKPGDRVMLVTIKRHQHGEKHIVPATVAKVYATGHVVLDGCAQRYRSDGRPTGKQPLWSSPPTIEPWSDAEWQDFQRRQARDAAAWNVYKLGDTLLKMSRDNEDAAALWEKLPFSVRCLVDDDAPQQK
jgi:hypothetical protein